LILNKLNIKLNICGNYIVFRIRRRKKSEISATISTENVEDAVAALEKVMEKVKQRAKDSNSANCQSSCDPLSKGSVPKSVSPDIMFKYPKTYRLL